MLEAQGEFQDILRQHPDLRMVLQNSLDTIENYRSNDPWAGPRMQDATWLKYSQDYRDQLCALELFAEVGNDPKRSSYTVEAQHEWKKMADRLRNELLPRLAECVNQLHTELSEQDLAEAGLWASLLRQGNLAWEQKDKRIVREIEVASKRRQAEKLTSALLWNEAVAVWEKLEEDWPGELEIQIEARKARKRRSIFLAEQFLWGGLGPVPSRDILRS